MISQLNGNILRGIVVLFAFFPFTITAQNSGRGCATFNVTNTYTTIGQSYRISKGITCSQSLASGSSCLLEFGGYIELERTGNFTSNGTTQDVTSLFNTIYDAVLHSNSIDSTPLKLLNNSSPVGGISNGTVSVQIGQSRFVAFTPYYTCVVGTVDGCASGFLTNGALLEACSAEVLTGSSTLNGTYPVWDGVMNAVVTDQGTVANMTTNPNAVPPESAKTSEGSKSSQQGLLLGLSVLALLACFL